VRDRLADDFVYGPQNAVRRLPEVLLVEGNIFRSAAEGLYDPTSNVLDNCLGLRFLDTKSRTLVDEVHHPDWIHLVAVADSHG
jgi:hypothetical protein